LSPDNQELLKLKGNVDVISISAVPRQWGWNEQLEAAKKLVAFTKPGSLVVGYQIGNVKGNQVITKSLQLPVWRHDPASFVNIWDQVGVETGTTWKTEAWLRSCEHIGWNPKDMAWLNPGDKVIDFVVTRRG
jgi:hypothetical protein